MAGSYIVLRAPSISQAERMLTEFDRTCGWSSAESAKDYSGHVEHVERSGSGAGEEETSGLGAYKSIEDVVKKTRNTRLRAHLFSTTVLSALT
ncbi:hypothetical protein RB195_014188 [Necator americanus]|uniref:Uncharacterized protein n=1 Tax=Necator americanus TaxID=51031 RepID=A0ABR1DZ05_NECAM